MKLKIRFPGWLWPFRKQSPTQYQTVPSTRKTTEWKYIIGLLVLWLIVMLFSVMRCNAQIKPLQVGDKVPDIDFINVLNYKSPTLRLSDFKDKVVILDFWATWCTSCLAKFPEERELQRKMQDSMQIILVNPKNTRNTHAKVAAFFKERQHLYDFPSIDEDTILSKFFPGAAVPRFAWIRKNVVVAIPEPEALTVYNVRAIYNNRNISVASGKKRSIDLRQGFFGNDNDSSSGIRYYSFIGNYRQDLYPTFNMETNPAGNVTRIDAINMSVSDLIQLCSPSAKVTPQRTIRHVTNNEAFSPDSTSLQWRKKYRFIYESTFSPRSSDAALTLMRGEIGRYFKLSIDTVVRDTTCYVITLHDTSKIVHGKKGVHGETNIYDHLNTPIFFRDESMSSITSTLEQQFRIPFINESGFPGKIDLVMPPNFSDFKKVSEAFEKQGFRIIPTRRKLTYLLIRDLSDSTHQNQSTNP
jgi:thiol-disulfide isomerase/thioredoxin